MRKMFLCTQNIASIGRAGEVPPVLRGLENHHISFIKSSIANPFCLPWCVQHCNSFLVGGVGSAGTGQAGAWWIFSTSWQAAWSLRG